MFVVIWEQTTSMLLLFRSQATPILWLFGRQTISMFIVMRGTKQLQGLRLFVSQATFFMVIWEPNNLNLEAKQPSREPQVEPSCASSKQISSLLHGSWSQAVSVSNMMCDPNNLY